MGKVTTFNFTIRAQMVEIERSKIHILLRSIFSLNGTNLTLSLVSIKNEFVFLL